MFCDALVFGLAQTMQMIWVDACGIAANMMNFISFRDRTMATLKGEAVREKRAAQAFEECIPTSNIQRACPFKASVLCKRNARVEAAVRRTIANLTFDGRLCLTV